MKATIVNYRLSRHVQKPTHMIIKIDGYETRAKSAALLGKTVTWKSPAGKEIKGKIASEHGNKGAVRVIFEKGMPGQSIGEEVEIS